MSNNQLHQCVCMYIAKNEEALRQHASRNKCYEDMATAYFANQRESQSQAMDEDREERVPAANETSEDIDMDETVNEEGTVSTYFKSNTLLKVYLLNSKNIEVDRDYPDAIVFDHLNNVADLTNLESHELALLRLTETHGISRDAQRQISALTNTQLLAKIDPQAVNEGNYLAYYKRVLNN